MVSLQLPNLLSMQKTSVISFEINNLSKFKYSFIFAQLVDIIVEFNEFDYNLKQVKFSLAEYMWL